ncbi:hypothetical protein, partial [Nonomuraea terrae]|uniref:hypothetical protein n=1 Tax=Nonomuraea terrae TaxID=2530383 RepID=UPI001CB71F1A
GEGSVTVFLGDMLGCWAEGWSGSWSEGSTALGGGRSGEDTGKASRTAVAAPGGSVRGMLST